VILIHGAKVPNSRMKESTLIIEFLGPVSQETKGNYYGALIERHRMPA